MCVVRPFRILWRKIPALVITKIHPGRNIIYGKASRLIVSIVICYLNAYYPEHTVN